MYVKLRASIALTPGMRVRYDCPSMSQESWEADRFFKKYKDRHATVLGHSSLYVGFADALKREPGKYINPERARILFDGEGEKEMDVMLHHFFLISGGEAREANADDSMRIGNLPEAEHFADLDIVREKGDMLGIERRIVGISIDESTGIATYAVGLTAQELSQSRKEDSDVNPVGSIFRRAFSLDAVYKRMPYDELFPVRKGALSLLREGGASAAAIEAALEDASHALSFWTTYGGGEYLPKHGRPETLEDAIERVGRNEAVLIDDHGGVFHEKGRKLIDLRKLNEFAAPHEAHVRELSLSHWRARLTKKEPVPA